jgi:hypothetical protein
MWFRTVFAFLSLLIICAVSASAQSSRGTLTISLQVVPSTVIIIGEDGKARILEANGANGLTITTVDATANASATQTNTSTITATPRTQQATPAQVIGTPSN